MKIALLYGSEILLIDKELIDKRNIIVVETRFNVLIDGKIYTAYRHTDIDSLVEIEKIYNNLECNIYTMKDKLVKTE